MDKMFIIEVLADGMWRSEGEHYATVYSRWSEADRETSRMCREDGRRLEDVRITELKAPTMPRWLVRDREVFLGIISAPDEDSASELAIAMAVTAGIDYSETLTWERLS